MSNRTEVTFEGASNRNSYRWEEYAKSVEYLPPATIKPPGTTDPKPVYHLRQPSASNKSLPK